MIEGVIAAVVDAASPAITRWRSFFLLVSLVLMSPELESVFSQNILSINLSSVVSLFGDLLSSSKALVAAGLALSFYFFVPLVNSFVLKCAISKSMRAARPLVEQLQELRASPKETIEKIIAESFDAKKETAKASALTIDADKVRAEVLAMACVQYFVAAIFLDVFCFYLFLALLIAYFFSAYILSRRILICYLRDVATYKVLEDYVKYLVLIK